MPPGPDLPPAVREAMRAISSRILLERRDQGLSLRELAGLAEVNRSVIGRIERNQGNPTLETLLRLAIGLQVSAEWLLSGRGPKEP